MKLINNISINLVELPEAGGLKRFKILGDDGAKFIIIVSNSSGDYYNFNTQTFSAGHSPQKMLKGTISGSFFEGVIVFPGVAGANYDILLQADPTDNTEMRRGKPINKRLKQLGNTTLTLAVATTNQSLFYNTFPSNIAITNSPTAPPSTNSINWTITNITSNVSDGFGSGLMFNAKTVIPIIQDSAWYFSTTDTVNGTISGSNELVVDSVDNLFAGMSIVSGVTGFSGADKPVIAKIDPTTKTLFLNKTCNAGDGVTLTFNGYGLANINAALGCSISVSLKITNIAEVTTTVRGAVSGTTVNVNGTYGISGLDNYNPGTGNTHPAAFSGVNAQPAVVTSVTANATQGSFVSSVAQSFKGGEKLTFSHINKDFAYTTQFTVEGTLNISSHPSSNQTIFFDLDKFVTTGQDD